VVKKNETTTRNVITLPCHGGIPVAGIMMRDNSPPGFPGIFVVLCAQRDKAESIQAGLDD
jgi:hypothetical protein